MSRQGHNPVAIANEFIELSGSKGIYLTKLLKLSYIAHGIMLAIHDKPLADEYAEAWKFGPIFPSIYHAFKHEGSRRITQKAQALTKDKRALTDWTSHFSADEREIIEAVYEQYKDHTASQLVAITHAAEGPWATAWKDGQYIRGFSIRNDLIADYYKNLRKARELRKGVS